MAISKWCDINSWFKNDNFSIPANKIPINEIDDIIIEDNDYLFNVLDNSCYSRIPSLVCNNLYVIPGFLDNVGNDIDVIFSCQKLIASNVVINSGIICIDWDNNICEWTVKSFSGFNKFVKLYCTSEENFWLSNSISREIYLNCPQYISLNECTFNKGRIQTENGKISGTSLNNINLIGIYDIVSSELISCTGNGEFKFLNNSKNSSTIYGDTLFLESKNDSKSIIYGPSIFSGINSSINSGIIVGDCTFFNSQNFGTISGNAIFTSGSINSGVVTNDAIFYSGTINYGNIFGDAIFEYSNNYGMVSGNAVLNTGNNYGKLLGGSTYMSSGLNTKDGFISGLQIQLINSSNEGQIKCPLASTGAESSTCSLIESDNQNILVANTINTKRIITTGYPKPFNGLSGTITCESISIGSGYFNGGDISSLDYTFMSTSSNDGTIGPGVVVPISETTNKPDISRSYQSGTVVFNSGCHNNGIILSPCISTFNNAINLGNISGGCIFNKLSYNLSSINANNYDIIYFNDISINKGTILSSSSQTIFNDNSLNDGTIYSFVYFNNRSKNSETGNIRYASFKDLSQNSGRIENGYFFNDAINNGFITNSGDFFDSSQNLYPAKISGVVNFYNASINSGDINLANAKFYDNSKNYDYIYGNRSKLFFDNSQNFGSVNNAKFYDTSVNVRFLLGITEFYNNSSNKGSSSFDDDTYFYDDSTNNGLIDKAFFFDRSTNQHNIITYSGLDGLIIFNNSSQNLQPIQNRTIIFNDTSSNQSTLKIILTPQYSPSGNTINFNTQAENRSEIIEYNSIIFSSGAENYGDISVTGTGCMLVFQDGSINLGYININNDVQFQNAINSGSIRNQAHFEDSTNFGKVPYATFNNSINSGIINYGIFMQNSTNLTNIASGVFNNSNNSGYIFQNGIFSTYSSNRGNVGNNADFTDYSANYGIINGNGSFFTYSCNYGTVLGELLTDSSCTG